MPSLVLALTLTASTRDAELRCDVLAHSLDERRELGAFDDDRRIHVVDREAGFAHGCGALREQLHRIGIFPTRIACRESARRDRRAPPRRATRPRARGRARRRRSGRARHARTERVRPPRSNARPSTSRCASKPWPTRVILLQAPLTSSPSTSSGWRSERSICRIA